MNKVYSTSIIHPVDTFCCFNVWVDTIMHWLTLITMAAIDLAVRAKRNRKHRTFCIRLLRHILIDTDTICRFWVWLNRWLINVCCWLTLMNGKVILVGGSVWYQLKHGNIDYMFLTLFNHVWHTHPFLFGCVVLFFFVAAVCVVWPVWLVDVFYFVIFGYRQTIFLFCCFGWLLLWLAIRQKQRKRQRKSQRKSQR